MCSLNVLSELVLTQKSARFKIIECALREVVQCSMIDVVANKTRPFILVIAYPVVWTIMQSFFVTNPVRSILEAACPMAILREVLQAR